jgi:hypothetical protein
MTPAIAAIAALTTLTTMFPSTEKDIVIAWSADWGSVAVRHEDQVMVGDETSEDAKVITLISVQLFKCGDEKPFKLFPVTTEKNHKAIHRKKGWQAAERWLKKNDYVFVIGKNKKIDVELDTAIPEKVPNTLQVFGLPMKQQESLMDRDELYLHVAQIEKSAKDKPRRGVSLSVTVEWADHTESETAVLKSYLAQPYAALGAPSCKTFSYGPKGACLAFVCTEPGPMGSTYSHFHSYGSELAMKTVHKLIDSRPEQPIDTQPPQ